MEIGIHDIICVHGKQCLFIQSIEISCKNTELIRADFTHL